MDDGGVAAVCAGIVCCEIVCCGSLDGISCSVAAVASFGLLGQSHATSVVNIFGRLCIKTILDGHIVCMHCM